MAPTGPIFTYVPSDGVIKAPSLLETVVVRANNVTLSPIILLDSLIRDMKTSSVTSLPLLYGMPSSPHLLTSTSIRFANFTTLACSIPYLTRNGQDHLYTRVIFVSELPKYGFSEWKQIEEIIKNHKGKHAQELKLGLDILIKNVSGLNLVSIDPLKGPYTSSSAPRRKKSYHSNFLLPYGTKYIDNFLSVGVDAVQHVFIRTPEHRMFYLESQNHTCFHRTNELLKAPTEHLVHLHLECMGHKEQKDYHWLIAYELVQRLQELGLDEYKWIKPEIIKDVEKLMTSSFGQA